MQALENALAQQDKLEPVLKRTLGVPLFQEQVIQVKDRLQKSEQALVVKEQSNGAEDFDRLEKLTEYLENEPPPLGQGLPDPSAAAAQRAQAA